MGNRKLLQSREGLSTLIFAVALLVLIFFPIFVPMVLGAALASSAWLIGGRLANHSSITKKRAHWISCFLVFFIGLVIFGAGVGALVTLFRAGIWGLSDEKIMEYFKDLEESNFLGTIKDYFYEFGLGDLEEHYMDFGKLILAGLSKILGLGLAQLPWMSVSLVVVTVVFFAIYFYRKPIDEFVRCQNLVNRNLLHQTLSSFSAYSYSTFFTTLICSVVQGLLIFLGAWITGLSYPLMWALLAALFAYIPFVGTTPISILLLVILIFQHGFSAEFLWMLLFAGAAGLSDNLIRSFLIGSDQKAIPVLTFLSIIGGVYVFGPLGVFLGPILAGVATDLLSKVEKS